MKLLKGMSVIYINKSKQIHPELYDVTKNNFHVYWVLTPYFKNQSKNKLNVKSNKNNC